MTSRMKVLNRITEIRAPIPPELVPQPSAQMLKLQARCSSLVRITIIDGTLTKATEPESDA